MIVYFDVYSCGFTCGASEVLGRSA